MRTCVHVYLYYMGFGVLGMVYKFPISNFPSSNFASSHGHKFVWNIGSQPSIVNFYIDLCAMKFNDLSDHGKEYFRQSLDVTTVDPDPFVQFGRWMEDALSAVEEPTAMTLATVGQDGKPSARMVLLKGFDENGFVFFTNYKSRKGAEIEANPNVSLVFYWKELERQVRIEGNTTKTTSEESDEYFKSRPVESQAGAVISPQSQVIRDRQELESKMKELLSVDEDLVRPPHWGGYRVKPVVIEFWQGRPARLHDRIRYIRKGQIWQIERLAP